MADRGTCWVHYYRTKIDTTGIRVERWVEKSSGRVHWRTRDARNTLTVYGLDPSGLGRVADPADPTRTFAWLAEAQYDPAGNAVRFEYRAENTDGVDRAAPAERGRPTGPLPQRYLKRVSYGNTVPLSADTPDPAGLIWSYEAVLDYGDHAAPADAPADVRPTPMPDQPWPVRADPFSSCRPGFDVRTYRLCRRVLQFHQFDALGPGATLVGSYRLGYDEQPDGTTLLSVTRAGYRRDIPARRSAPPAVVT